MCDKGEYSLQLSASFWRFSDKWATVTTVLREATFSIWCRFTNCQSNFSKRENSHKTPWHPRRACPRAGDLCRSAVKPSKWVFEVTAHPRAGLGKEYENERSQQTQQAGRAHRGSPCGGWSSTADVHPRGNVTPAAWHCLPGTRVEIVSPAESTLREAESIHWNAVVWKSSTLTPLKSHQPQNNVKYTDGGSNSPSKPIAEEPR